MTLHRRRASRLASLLVHWYRSHARPLPWRESRDPYGIWVSEVMLQQTRVETVVHRWARFMERFPDLVSLARAPLSEVLAEWAGLGYYRRARQLHAAAQAVVEKEGADLPQSAAALRLLPGFGAYTAGAVASIAFDEAVPAVDGNVERVLCRLLALETDPRRAQAAVAIREAAGALVSCEAPRELNQALMELGALLCKPAAPLCDPCPWRRSCAAYRSGVPESFPRRAPRRPSVEVSCYAAVLREGRRLLLRRRPEGGLNAGLWELPTTPWHAGAAEESRARQDLAELAAELGAVWTVGEPLAQIRHGITHHRVRVVGYAVHGGSLAGPDRRWATPQQARELGLTAAANKLLGKLPSLI